MICFYECIIGFLEVCDVRCELALFLFFLTEGFNTIQPAYIRSNKCSHFILLYDWYLGIFMGHSE